jgi:uncharacterized protein YceK
MKRLVLPVTVLVLAGCGSTATRTITETTSVASTPAGTAAPTSATSTTATVRPARPVYFQGALGGLAVRPISLQLTADGTLSVERVQWDSWGGPTARGSGSALFHGCIPNCAAAPTHAAVVSIRLSDVRTCGGKRYYAGVTLRLSSGRLLDQSFLQRSWSPC